MITLEDRQTVKIQLIKGDYIAAQEIYRDLTGRAISEQYLYMFISGRKPCTGSRPGSHQPEDLYYALCKAIADRLAKGDRYHKLAADIRASTIEAAQAAAIH